MDRYEIIEKKLGLKIGEYRKKWERAGRDEGYFDYPLHLNFELTFGCNLSCDFCLCGIPFREWSYDVDSVKSISFNKYKEIVNEGSQNGLYSVELNGINEPLLKNDIDEYIKYAKRKNILITSLHSNAFALTREVSEKIINSGLDLIIFSVDGVKEKTYELIRGGGSFNKVVNNINRFLDIKEKMNKKNPVVQMSFSKNKVNHKEIDGYVSYWENKVDIISTSFFCNPFIDTEREKEIEDKYRLEDFDMGDCYEPFQRLLIRQDGKVHPCCSFFGGEYIIGDIYKNSIREIWNGTNMAKIRLGVNSKDGFPICHRCRESMRTR